MTTPVRFIAVQCQIVGNPADWLHAYTSDLALHADRQAAIDHGIDWLGHDDFCVGTIDGSGQLVAYGFGHEDFAPEDRDDLGEIARQLGLPGASTGGDCLDCAIRKVKADLGVETTTADLIARHLPEHLRQPFWQRAVGRHLDAEMARLDAAQARREGVRA